MQDEKKLRELLLRTLPEINIKKLTIVGEKTIQAGVDIHGVRLDVFAEDDSYIEELESAVIKARMNKRWRKEYMTVEQERMHMEAFVERRGKELDCLLVVRRMMQKGFDVDEISDCVGREASEVEVYITALNECGPTAEINEVYNYIHRNDGYEKI